MATPERINANLNGNRALDRTVLHALWRLADQSLQTGASVDLDMLTRDLGVAYALVAVLDRLHSER
jgi:hypothetical protein